jgi:hypothetical protein
MEDYQQYECSSSQIMAEEHKKDMDQAKKYKQRKQSLCIAEEKIQQGFKELQRFRADFNNETEIERKKVICEAKRIYSERMTNLCEREKQLELLLSQKTQELLPSLILLLQQPIIRAAVRETVPICSICMRDNALSEYSFKCGHLCMCQKCSKSQCLTRCPICRTEGTIMRIYV